MHPILFEIGPITIYSYGVLLAAAYLLGLWLAAKASCEVRRRSLGQTPESLQRLQIAQRQHAAPLPLGNGPCVGVDEVPGPVRPPRAVCLLRVEQALYR